MTTAEFIHQVCQEWLACDQTDLTAPQMEALIRALNRTVDMNWRKLPIHYRRRQLSVSLDAAVTGTGAVTRGSTAITLSLAGDPQANYAREYCYMEVGGVRNEYQNGKLLIPWNAADATVAVTLHHNVAQLDWKVDVFNTAVMEVGTNRAWAHTPGLPPWNLCRWPYDKVFDIVRQPVNKITKTLFRVAPVDAASRQFEAGVTILPNEWTMADTVLATELPYDNEVARIFIGLAGFYLMGHQRTANKPLDLYNECKTALAELPRAPTTAPNSLGTPYDH